LGFSYSRDTFNSVSGTVGLPYTLSVGPLVSELGVANVQFAYPFQSGDFAVIPTVTLSGWHEFAGAVPAQFFVANTNNNQPYMIANSRVGTFGQLGVGVAVSPLKLPNLLLFVRGDLRSGQNIQGGTGTFGARYSF
jgi:hypothetical protein